MAVDGPAPSRHNRSLFDALFGEAWELERHRRRTYLALSVLVCLASGSVVALTDGGKSSPAAIAPPKPVGLYAAGTVDVGGSPQALLTHAGSLWIATPSSVVRLNLRNGSTIARIPIPTNGVNAGLAFGAGSIWLAPTGASRLLRIDPSSNRLVANIPRVAANGRAALARGWRRVRGRQDLGQPRLKRPARRRRLGQPDNRPAVRHPSRSGRARHGRVRVRIAVGR